MRVSSSHVPVQSSRYRFFAASDALVTNSRTADGSLVSYATSRAGSSVETWARSWTGTFEVRSHVAQLSSSHTSSIFPLALTRIFPEARCRVPGQSGQDRTTVGRAD